ncbi:protein-disulfide reductase DsbD family protein [Lacipirellula parvula]|uniref:Uncharacterized protein n=1 Tax=Lacipirellula parvula TaxID=2650471 RepID=A0A5K7XHW2_9BACT|nr:protein-disulfide reductase DsbD family protein [Lacipirellula parvula]BBO36038.1 hypothetical protein PLANPX_5650 [Lacipirellula parvula]
MSRLRTLLRLTLIATPLALFVCAIGCGPPSAPTSSTATDAALVQPAADVATAATASDAIVVRVEQTPIAAALVLPQRSALPGAQFELAVELEIAPQWEVRALGANSAAGIATTLQLTLPPGVSAVGEWVAPSPTRSIAPDGHPVHVGKSTFKRTLKIEPTAHVGETAINCKIDYQACNERSCMRPEAIELAAPFAIAAP